MRTMHPSRTGSDLRLVGDDATILAAPVGEGGSWGALRRIRAAMRELGEARLTFLFALTRDGRIVDLLDEEGVLVVAGSHDPEALSA